MTLSLQPVRIRTESSDEEGRLVMAEGFLVAILIQLSADHGTEAGYWFLEVGFGRLQGQRVPTFPTLDDASRWLRRHLKPV